MGGNYFVEKRRQDKQSLLKILNENPEIPRVKALAIFSIKTGLKLKTIKEYVEELEKAEVIEQEM